MAAWRKMQAVALSDAQRTSPPWWAWAVAASTIFVLSLAGVTLTPPGGSVAAWWPAAGVGAFFILRTPRSRWWIVLVMVAILTGAANTIAGRDILVAGMFAMANAVEIGLFAALLCGRRGQRSYRLETVDNAWRFALSALAASAVLGVLIGIVVAGSAANPAEVGGHAAVSHAAAILMIAPFAVLPPHIGQPTRWIEVGFQVLTLGGIITYLLVTDNALPLTFLPVAILAWGAFRFPIRAAYTEALIANLVILAATVAGVGPFGTSTVSPTAASLLCALFLLVTAINNLFLTTGSYELRANARAAKNVADLVTTGIVDSRIGLLVAEPRNDGWAVLLANTAARRILGTDIDKRMRWLAGPLRDAAEQSIEGTRVVSLETHNRLLNIDASVTAGEAPRVSVQLVDITESVRAAEERVAAETESATALAARRELERRQVDFIATASHELRTPIASVSGYLELLDESEDLQETSREWIGVAQRNTARLGDLIDDLLLLARANDHAGAPDLTGRIPVAELVDDAIAPFAETARERNVALIVAEVQGSTVGVRHELVRALGSLISNSLKFSPDNTSVLVNAEIDADGLILPDGSSAPAIRVSVQDHGPGIAAEELPHVFERFYRTPDAEIAHTAGVGLGLALAKELVEANGGRVEISSPDRQGVLAVLVLPTASSTSDEI